MTLRFWSRLKPRLYPLLDLSAWCLIITAAIPLALFQPSMLITLGTWTAYGIALAGISIMLNRLVLPMVRLQKWLELAREGNVAAAIVVAAVLALYGILFIGMIIWAKA